MSNEQRAMRKPGVAEPLLAHAPAPIALVPKPVEISIVVVTWNSERWIRRCLDAIPAACDGIEYEIVLHDNASADGTLQLVGDDVSILRASANEGFAAGSNHAIAHTRGRYAFLLNPDCELAPRALTMLLEYLESHPEVAAAVPLLEDERGDSQREFQLRRLPTLRTLATEVLLIDKLFPRNGTRAHHRYRDLDLTEPRRVEQPAAAALLIRREVYDEIGPLDEQFSPAWFEDVDYCRRLAQAGKEIHAVPAARARHFGGASLEHVPFPRFAELWYGHMMRYARKWMTPGQAEMLRWMIIIGMILRLIPAALGFGHPEVTRWDALRGYVGVLQKALREWAASSPSSS